MNNFQFKTIILLCFVTFLLPGNIFGQKKIDRKTKKIVNEGKMLYKSEITSWYGTDLFLENYKDRDKISGYFSYVEENQSKCIFFSKNNESGAKVIGTITFKEEYSMETGDVNLKERDFTILEKSLFEIRENALQLIRKDPLFKQYENMRFNVIPIIKGKERKVYVLTGPSVSGVVVFGNDYLIKFNKKNEVTSRKALHRNIIPIDYIENKASEETIHSHTKETGDFITATDICTLMLYSKFAGWKTHNVVSQKYLNQWNCLTNELSVISMKTIRKIDGLKGKIKTEEN